MRAQPTMVSTLSLNVSLMKPVAVGVSGRVDCATPKQEARVRVHSPNPTFSDIDYFSSKAKGLKAVVY